MTGDPYLYPGTQTLKNSYGIRTDDLEQVERVITRFAMRRPLDPPPEMTPEGLQQIHRHIFGRVYPWAGEFRTINIQKIVTDEKTVTFERGPFIRPSVMRFFADLQGDTYLRGLDPKTFAYRAAVYMEDLNFIHPFREGNGRSQRLFLQQLARRAGHDLDLSRIDVRGWMDGSIQSFRQPIDGAHDIMTHTIERALTGPYPPDQKRTLDPAPEPPSHEHPLDTARNKRGRPRTRLVRDPDERDR